MKEKCAMPGCPNTTKQNSQSKTPYCKLHANRMGVKNRKPNHSYISSHFTHKGKHYKKKPKVDIWPIIRAKTLPELRKAMKEFEAKP
jgi:hypothetical protein